MNVGCCCADCVNYHICASDYLIPLDVYACDDFKPNYEPAEKAESEEQNER